ncbi:MAG: hypothetical protein KAI55_03955 [Candidatus Aenigmarchaeota archaeon]|nr:hypothetical protein [Candidatus Aenigmarchaeota archaeon]
MGSNELLTAKDKLVYRFFLLATLFLSPIGLLYVSHYDTLSIIDIKSFIYIIPLLSTPLVMISYFLHISCIENRTSELNSIKKYVDEIKEKRKQNIIKIIDSIKEYVKKKVPFLIIKDNLSILNHKYNGEIHEQNNFEKACDETKKELKSLETNFLISVLEDALMTFYIVSFFLFLFNFFIQSIELEYFLLIQYSSYGFLLFYKYGYDIYSVKKNTKDFFIKKNMMIRGKDMIEFKENMCLSVDIIKKEFEKETNGLKKKSKEYKRIVTKYSKTLNKLLGGN